MQEDGTLVEIRPGKVEEVSRFRANKFPYAEAHGIGLSGGGLDVSLETMAGKTEAQIKREAGAKLKNWWLTDIEKVRFFTVFYVPVVLHILKCSMVSQVLVEGERLNPVLYPTPNVPLC